MHRFALALGCLALAAPALADYVVFRDGRYLKAERVRFEGQDTVVDLEGGAHMRFRTSRVKFVAPDHDVEEAPARAVAAAIAPAGHHWRSFADPRFVESIERVSERYSLEPALVAAVVKIESDFRPHAVSPAGAKGLMQLMPLTAKEHDVTDPFDVEQNLTGGAAHLVEMLQRYDGEIHLALAAYNAGQVAVDKAKGVPPYPETQRYVEQVMRLANGG